MPNRPLIALSLAVSLVACTRAANDAQRLEEAYRAASAEYDVPRPILEAIGWVETRWDMHGGEPSNDQGYGVMHLVDDGAEGPLARASRLTGLPEDELKRDLASNVRGAAALLREDADRYFAETPLKDPQDLSSWWQVVMRWSNARAPEIADDYATMVYRAMGRGEGAYLADGSLYELTAVQVDVTRDKLFGAMEFPLSPDYPSARWIAALRYTSGRGSYPKADRVIIHTAQGSYNGTVSWFQNPQVQASSHYVVSAGGAITSMVHDRDTAWHAGNWDFNERSIGIEHEGYVTNAGWATDAMYEASANLTRWLCDTYGIPKDRTHVIGHYEVPGCSGLGGGRSCHTDPCFVENGRLKCLWSWERYMALVGGNTGPATGTLRGSVFSAEGGAAPSGNTKPIQGARVFVTETNDTAITGANGSFSFRLPPGTYHAKASAAGFIEGQPYLGETRTVTANADTWSSFVLQPVPTTGVVKGFVYEINVGNSQDRSRRIAGAQVSAGGSTVSAADDGTFSITVPAGEQTVEATRAGFITASQTIPVAAGTTQTIELGLRAGGEDDRAPAITFTKPADGATVNEASVVVEGTLDELPIALQVGGLEGTWTEDLRFSATVALVPGDNVIEAIAMDASGNIGEASITVKYVVPVAEGVTGRVLDATSGEGLADAVVAVGEAFAKTAADGAFRLPLAAGPHALEVQAVGFATRTVNVTVPARSMAQRTISLVPTGGEPIVAILTPAHRASFTGTTVAVTGRTRLRGAKVAEVNGTAATLQPNGSFAAALTIKDGVNRIIARVLTEDGLEGSAEIEVTRTPPLRDEDDGCGCAGTGAEVSLLALLGLAVRRRRARG